MRIKSSVLVIFLEIIRVKNEIFTVWEVKDEHERRGTALY